MRWRSAPGAIFWATAVGLAAYWLGHSAGSFFKTAGAIGAGGLVVVGLAAFAFVRARRRRRKPV